MILLIAPAQFMQHHQISNAGITVNRLLIKYACSISLLERSTLYDQLYAKHFPFKVSSCDNWVAITGNI